MKDRSEYTTENCKAAIPYQERLIKDLESAEPAGFDAEYGYWQSRITCAQEVLRGLRNPDRGRESLDSFARHGGVNVHVRLLELEWIARGIYPEDYPGQRAELLAESENP